jgi:hypothetical protein
MLLLAVAAQAAGADDSTHQPLQLTLPTDWQQVAQQGAAPAAAATTDAPTSPIGDYFRNWFARVEQAQASQPHWMTPLVTVTPRLEQEVRYDQYWQTLGNGAEQNTFGSGKGLELIPTTTNEILINPPPYIERYSRKPATGWGDAPFFIVKQRLLSANEQDGNYIVTTFFGVTAPMGSEAFSTNAWVITPTIAGGKGWGDFDIQATFGIPIPLAHQNVIGTSLTTNVALQYHFAQYFWPEFEINHTLWLNGVRGGKNQVFLTPGIIFGRIPIYHRVKAVIGVGYQFAVTPEQIYKPVLTPVYNHAWLLSARIPF